MIADGLNYIKGFRYQLYCEAKAIETPHCMVRSPITIDFGSRREPGLTSLEVHVGTPIQKCKEINTQALENNGDDKGYAQDLFENLVYRYEEPNGMNRWDSPLFTVPFDDETPPFDNIWAAIIGSEGKAKTVKPNQATVMVSLYPRHQ